ncbi:MAG: hypothetical protein L6V93_18650 [Clostridiales bacterium]|nr:MAG: hypothetical protein L6V93_18650 [Clostridiales bacterium]
MTKIPYKIYLTEDEMPKKWLNLRAFMKKTSPNRLSTREQKQPCTLDELSHIFLHRACKTGA